MPERDEVEPRSKAHTLLMKTRDNQEKEMSGTE
jgi:hypothetical protein